MSLEEIANLLTPTDTDIERVLTELNNVVQEQKRLTEEWNKTVRETIPKLKIGDYSAK